MIRKSSVARCGAEDAELRLWVRKGRLFDVQRWIAAGKPLYRPSSPRSHALTLAVEVGFHSMVEVLARAWPDRESLNAAASLAAHRRQSDLVWLLMECGADMRSIPLGEVAECHDRDLMRYFLEHWHMLDEPDGLTDVVTTGSHALLGVIRECAPNIPNHQFQLARALTYFVGENRLKWVSLALWLGADPRLLVPEPYSTHEIEPDEWMSPMEFAVEKGDLAALKLMKPSFGTDDLDNLLARARLWHDDSAVSGNTWCGAGLVSIICRTVVPLS